MIRHAWCAALRGTTTLMAHPQRTAALASGFLLALIAVGCESQMFDLLPESAAGAAGQANTGGKSGFSTGGISNSGGNRNFGGQSSGGAFGGHGGQGSGGPGWDLQPPPPGCSAFCGPNGCVRCTDNSACGPGGKCFRDCVSDPSVEYGVCVQCIETEDCTVPSRGVCLEGVCVECESHDDCGSWYCDATRNVCVQCLGPADCQKYASRPACDQRGMCVECLTDSTCPSGRCYGGQCACSNHEQCQGAPGGPACILERCQRCGKDTFCPKGETCQFDPGRCVRSQ